MKAIFYYAALLLCALTLLQCKKSHDTESASPTEQITLTVAVTSQTATSITITATLTGPTGTAITERGVCWSVTTTAPSVTDTKIASGSGLGTFNTTISNASP